MLTFEPDTPDPVLSSAVCYCHCFGCVMLLLVLSCSGCGKTALVEELARATGNTDMVRVHVDDQMDSKSLLGAYVCTTNPGEFVWQPGPLTQVSQSVYQ